MFDEARSFHGRVDPKKFWDAIGGKWYVYTSEIDGIKQFGIFLKDNQISRIDIDTSESISTDSLVNEFGNFNQAFNRYDDLYVYSWNPSLNGFVSLFVEDSCREFSQIEDLTSITLIK